MYTQPATNHGLTAVVVDSHPGLHTLKLVECDELISVAGLAAACGSLHTLDLSHRSNLQPSPNLRMRRARVPRGRGRLSNSNGERAPRCEPAPRGEPAASLPDDPFQPPCPTDAQPRPLGSLLHTIPKV